MHSTNACQNESTRQTHFDKHDLIIKSKSLKLIRLWNETFKNVMTSFYLVKSENLLILYCNIQVYRLN